MDNDDGSNSNNDNYMNLGPAMKHRLDQAETEIAKVRDWLSLISERSKEDHFRARELCLVLGWPAPQRAAEPGGRGR